MCHQMFTVLHGGLQGGSGAITDLQRAPYLRSMILRTSNLSLRFLQPKVPRRLKRDVKSSRKPT